MNATTFQRGENNIAKRPEIREKIRLSKTGLHHSEETKKRISEILTGRKLSEETKRKLSETHKGRNMGDANVSRRPEVREKISQSLKGRYLGASHSNWKGGQEGLELRQAGRVRPANCEVCGNPPWGKSKLSFDHDHKTGGPKMPWHKADKKTKVESTVLGGMAVKYGLIEGKQWIGKMKPMKKGALHKELKVPMGKKIPAKKLNMAAKSNNPLEKKRAVLAKTFAKMKK